MLTIGDKAPGFTLLNQDDIEISLTDFTGQWLVLYFYPQDDTPGCTNEAIDFTATGFAQQNSVVIGISPDGTESHRQFIKKYDLKVILLSDVDKTVMKQYAAWGIKKNYGKEYEGVIRKTFLISPTGEIANIWSNVKVRVKTKNGESKHAEIVFKKLNAIK